ncbi:MFS transporter [Actinorugispora endophytica]|uniref:DHA1 family inner membrane transport protein n=1 Tax=Actinorugispora endophytica TaxID=1605990 RepID=A0A4R6USJ2_9ACTN|nr:MFS transporter [Actinorugispora endophytica]TDQ46334.1 DHA1 family inner membrane transport protein [Actinorugispora endophytica]
MPSLTTAPRPPSAALAVLALAIGGFGIGTTEFVAMGILPEVAADFDASIPAAGYMISGYALGVVVGAPLLTALGARVDRKALLIALMAMFTLGNVAAALAPTFSTLMAARVFTGLPHGTFFGIGSVVAAGLVPAHKRAQAISMMMVGLSVANIIGVPLATAAAQTVGWRSTYWMVTAVGLVTLVALAAFVPRTPTSPHTTMRSELGALKRPQVWLALATGAVGFGGMFASYSYIAPMMTEVAGLEAAAVPLVLAVYGVGMTAGNLLGGRLADYRLMASMYGSLAAIIVLLALFFVTAHHPVTAVATVFGVGLAGSALVPALQTRLIDVAPGAPSLAAALNHSALNLANASGAWLGGLVIAAGYGYTSPNLVGAVLAVLGLGLIVASGLLDRRAPAAAGPRAPVPSAAP